MHRFFIEPHAVEGTKATITGEDVQHIAKVLRLRSGDEVTLCDGAKTEYTAVIEAVEKETVTLHIVGQSVSATEPQAEITLYQGLPKAGKLETIVQKCVELGIANVIPFDAERSVVKLSEKDFAKKQPRYQRVAYEAAKQSRRGIIPEVGGLVKLAKEDLSGYDLVLLAYEEERGITLKQALRNKQNAKRIALIVGPEGGFAPEEADMLTKNGALSVSLGPRILRTETAGMAMLAMTLYELEF
ncbi:MAG: 16S rRNA (uracil(1498)-N(3))-methyltransferase [Clostridiales bacterium]|nr:16S rRNA (uracil(1498)-N(3))-methyltransferase [Clostridiales bacterium]